jgi:hypothetical protein
LLPLNGRNLKDGPHAYSGDFGRLFRRKSAARSG